MGRRRQLSALRVEETPVHLSEILGGFAAVVVLDAVLARRVGVGVERLHRSVEPLLVALPPQPDPTADELGRVARYGAPVGGSRRRRR